jgi:hypothetical protein
MRGAIGDVLPYAVGVAISPLPIVAVILMLLSRRAKMNGALFILGWLVGLAVVGVVVLAIAGPADANDAGEPATWVGVLKLVLGLLLVVLGIRRWRDRPGPGEMPAEPAWMATIDAFSPMKAAGAGAVLSALNPKNLILAVGAAASIAQSGISGGQQAVAYAVFAVIGTIGVAAPVVISLAVGERSAAILGRMRASMGQHNAAVMAALCLIIGAKLIGDGLGAL